VLNFTPFSLQMGTVVESAADFYGSRIPNKRRKLTLVDELLNDAEFRRYVKILLLVFLTNLMSNSYDPFSLYHDSD
jgi:hypothetical protein